MRKTSRMESVFMVTHPGHNQGHRSPVHRSRDPVACVPGPCHCPWGHDRVQGLPAKCSSRELPGRGPGQGASAFMDQRWFSSAQDFPSGIAYFLWALSVLHILPHVSSPSEPDRLLCGQSAAVLPLPPASPFLSYNSCPCFSPLSFLPWVPASSKRYF